MAWLTRFRIMRWLMRLAIYIIVPRQRIGAGVVLFNADGEILLLKHAFHGNYPWSVPGGWLNRNEAPATGALRELQEETGLSATLGPIIYLEPSPVIKSLEIHYLATEPRGAQKLSFEIIDAQWFAPDHLPSGMLPITRKVIGIAVDVYRKGAVFA